ncbi:hypothetical protein ES288_D05G320200v1 [Gossypium darwinii]|uniref:GED domain-containing protein n=1 Tax=Gossypium darwinii TaxID=34276 RepID=A0A5D2CR30_GOSDA|nr:hypothetical protein ES288_D05G320200v1 [Gossypium darwinii]
MANTNLLRRIIKETQRLLSEPAPGISASPSEDNMRYFNVMILGPTQSPCEGSTILSYVNMVCTTLRHSIPKSIVYCQVHEAKRSLFDFFYTELGKLEQKRLSALLNEDPAIMERRSALAKRLELYRSAQAEIDMVAWSK